MVFLYCSHVIAPFNNLHVPAFSTFPSSLKLHPPSQCPELKYRKTPAPNLFKPNHVPRANVYSDSSCQSNLSFLPPSYHLTVNFNTRSVLLPIGTLHCILRILSYGSMSFPWILSPQSVWAAQAQLSGLLPVSGTRTYAEMTPNPNLQSKSGTKPSPHWPALPTFHNSCLSLNPPSFSSRFHRHILRSPPPLVKGRHTWVQGGEEWRGMRLPWEGGLWFTEGSWFGGWG